MARISTITRRLIPAPAAGLLVLLGTGYAMWPLPYPMIYMAVAVVPAALVARHGEEKTRRILGRQTFNNLIYPNLSINPLFATMRMVSMTRAEAGWE